MKTKTSNSIFSEKWISASSLLEKSWDIIFGLSRTFALNFCATFLILAQSVETHVSWTFDSWDALIV